MSEPWIGTDATDSTWETTVVDDNEILGCLVVADFKNEKELEKAEKDISDNQRCRDWQKKYSVGKPKFFYAEMMGIYKQLQIDLGDFKGEFFAKGADYAEFVMGICKKAKGTVHFADRAE